MAERRWGGGVSVIALLASAIALTVGSSERVTQAAQPVPPVPIDVIGGAAGTPVVASENGPYVLIGRNVVDTRTNLVAMAVDDAPTDEFPFFPSGQSLFLHDDGTVFGAVAEPTQLISHRSLGGEIITVPVVLPAEWSALAVHDVDLGRRRVILLASSGVFAATRPFLVDLDTGRAITDTNDGLTTGSANSGTAWFLDDGRIAVAQSSFGLGVDHAVWAADLSSSASIDPPPEHDDSLGQTRLSRALDAMYFVTDDGGLVDGVDPGPVRIYRQDLDSGDIAVTPVETGTAHRWTPGPEGTLVLTIGDPPRGTTNRQLYSWDGRSDSLVRLTVRPDGSPSVGDVGTFAVSETGVITFESTANDLTARLPIDLWDRYVYRIDPEPPAVPEPDPIDPIDPTPPSAADLPAAALAAGETYCVPAVGARPHDFVGVNVTPVNAVRRGFGSVHSSDDAPPETANVNFRAGSVDPNMAFAEVGADGRICFTNSVHGPVDVVLDALVVADADSFRLPSPEGAVRLEDSRERSGGMLAPSETRCVAAVGGAPGEFAGVNITPVNAERRGNGALHSSDDDAPDTANVNFALGSVDPNLAFARIGADGEVCFSNSVHGPVDVVMDLLIIAAPGTFDPPTSTGARRLVDTRTGLGAPSFDADDTRCFAVGASPSAWTGLNLTPVGAVRNGNGAVHSSADRPPSTANVNFRLGSVDPNLALAQVGEDGTVCFSNSVHGPVELVVDELFVADPDVFRAPTEAGAWRLADTREGRHAAASPPTVELVADEIDAHLLTASHSGRYLILVDWVDHERFMYDVETGVSRRIEPQIGQGALIADDGAVYWTVSNARIARWDPIDGSITEVDSIWQTLGLADLDPNGGRALVDTFVGSSFRPYLIDLETGDPLGLPAGLADVFDVYEARFAADGSIVTREYSPVTQRFRYHRWDRDGTEVLDSVPEPEAHDRELGGSAVDREFGFLWFFSDEPDVVDGVPGGVPRLYRHEIASGEVIAAPTAAGVASSIVPLPDGGVLVQVDAPTGPAGVLGSQLFEWDGVHAELQQLSIGIDEADPNGVVDRVVLSPSGELVTLSSTATNLTRDPVSPRVAPSVYRLYLDR